VIASYEHSTLFGLVNSNEGKTFYNFDDQDSSGLVCLFLFALTICTGLAAATNNFENPNDLDDAKFQVK
jgi:hypothetical protein